MSDYDFGDTAPVLRVAQNRGISYETALYVVDFMVHGRVPPGGLSALPMVDEVTGQDLAAVAVRFRALRAGSLARA